MTDLHQPRVKIEAVAERAGVSVATVSRALRGLPNVAASTREHVTRIAEEMNYRANPAAARLAAGRTRTVTVVVPNLSGWYFSTVVAGAEAVCADAGYDLLVVGIGSEKDCRALLDDSTHLERRTDGLVIVDVPVSRRDAESLDRRGVSLATIGTTTVGVPSVRIDDIAVGRTAASHLVELGHRHMAIIGGQVDDPMGFQVPGLRREGFAARLDEEGIVLDDSLVVPGNFGMRGGQEAMGILLDRPDPPTAVFALSDEMAFGALMRLDSDGLRAGRDISLIGVDDHEFAQVVGLTTIRQLVAHHGAVAARSLIASMEPSGEHDAPSEIVETIELVVRSTTGPAH